MKLLSILLALAVAVTCTPTPLQKRVSGLDLHLYAERHCLKSSVFLTCFNVAYGQCCHRRSAVSGRFNKAGSGGSSPLIADEVLYGYKTGPLSGSPACYKDIDTSARLNCVTTTPGQGRIMTGVKVSTCSICKKSEKREELEETTAGCAEATHFTVNGTEHLIADMDAEKLAWMDSFFE